MTFTNRTGRLALAAILCAGACAAQESSFGASFKMRAGAGLTAPDDGLSRKTLGLGLDFSYGRPASRWNLEVGYQYKPGNQYLQNPAAMPTAPGMSVDPSQSVDSRKNQLGGLTVRLGWEHRLGQGPWALHAGLQGGGAKWRQEYVGDVTDRTNTYEDTYNGIVTVTRTAVSPYAGGTWNLDPTQALELNVVAVAYTSANYVHVAGTDPGAMGGGHTAWDFIQTCKRTVPTLEFVYVLRF